MITQVSRAFHSKGDLVTVETEPRTSCALWARRGPGASISEAARSPIERAWSATAEGPDHAPQDRRIGVPPRLPTVSRRWAMAGSASTSARATRRSPGTTDATPTARSCAQWPGTPSVLDRCQRIRRPLHDRSFRYPGHENDDSARQQAGSRRRQGDGPRLSSHIERGTTSTSQGTRTKRRMRRISTKTKGRTPLKIVVPGTSRSTLCRTKTFMPTGGVM